MVKCPLLIPSISLFKKVHFSAIVRIGSCNFHHSLVHATHRLEFHGQAVMPTLCTAIAPHRRQLDRVAVVTASGSKVDNLVRTVDTENPHPSSTTETLRGSTIPVPDFKGKSILACIRDRQGFRCVGIDNEKMFAVDEFYGFQKRSVFRLSLRKCCESRKQMMYKSYLDLSSSITHSVSSEDGSYVPRSIFCPFKRMTFS